MCVCLHYKCHNPKCPDYTGWCPEGAHIQLGVPQQYHHSMRYVLKSVLTVSLVKCSRMSASFEHSTNVKPSNLHCNNNTAFLLPVNA